MKLKVEIPDTQYWKDQIKCQSACPVHTDARGYVRAISEGKFEEAYLIARAPNPLASICGRVCGAPCESACRRGSIDQSISIRALKRSAHEEGFPSDLKEPLTLLKQLRETLEDRMCSGSEDLGSLWEGVEHHPKSKTKGKSIGIIGSGPAGLAAAHDLALMGFNVVIYEMEPVPAGMLYLGVPAYRLPREIIEAEVAVIQALGVQIKTNCAVGRDISFDDLRKRHDAVVIAVGCKKSRRVPIPGHDAEGVYGGVEFLRAVALNEPHHMGKKVVIIGGGNVAYDVARTALRRQQMDIVGTLRREEAGVEATLCCLEPREQMLADEIEILEGEEEGVKRINGYGPQKILTEKGKVKGVVFHKVISIFDENKRFNPQYDPKQELVLEADAVLMAVGQSSDISFIQPEKHSIKTNERGIVICDPKTQETTADGVFLAGDLAHGPKLMIDAIASGKKAARSIFHKLTGEKLKSQTVELHIPIEQYGREMGYEKLKRQALASAPVEQRIMGTQTLIEKGFSCMQAQVEASRCLDCGVNTVFDGNRCILCGACADICPELCLKLVPVSELDGNKDFSQLTDLVREQKQTDELSAIIKDEEKCIRCALCAIRCPADAITMERYSFKECFV
ncbi:MAG: FAD-dependent oxidoreductase [Candidatus Omnitrophica bacterium]|nr:FAD-dependent oxidoreductase [Candidatus Omnitrophota bacterium]